MAGWVGGFRNKAQLRPAKLELGLGLNLAKSAMGNFSLKEHGLRTLDFAPSPLSRANFSLSYNGLNFGLR